MARPYEEYSSEDKGHLKKVFDQINPDFWAKLQNHPDAIDNLKDVLADAEELRADIEQSQIEQRRTRIETAKLSIRSEREESTQNVSPHVREHLLSHDAILHEAHREVRLQEETELSQIDQFVEDNARAIAANALSQQTISQKEIANMSEQETETHIVKEMHKLANDAREARFQVSKLVASTREHMLEEARANGAADPAAQVKSVIASMYKGVEDKHHSDIQRTFEKYGYDKEHQQVRFFANNQDLETLELSGLQDSTQAVSADEQAEAGDQPAHIIKSDEDQSQ